MLSSSIKTTAQLDLPSPCAFQTFFPGLISACYVLRPASFLQRTWSDLSYKFSRDDFKFKVSARRRVSSAAAGAGT